MIDAHQVAMMRLRVAELDAVAIRRRRHEARARLPLVLVGAEEVCLVFHDWPADRESSLLVLQRQHPLRDEVGRVEPAVAEIPVEGPTELVGAGARDRRPVARSVAVTVTPGNTAFVSSVTVPTTEASVYACAAAALESNSERTIAEIR